MVGALVAVTAVWGATFVVVKDAIETLPVLDFLAWRFTLATVVMMLALAIATAGITNSPEHAQVTTLPLSLGTIAVASWVGITGTETLPLLKRALPGGAASELVVNAWNGPAALADSLLLVAATLAWVLVAVALASRMFRWEPRR